MIAILSLISVVVGLVLAMAISAPLGVVFIVAGALGFIAALMGNDETKVTQDDIDAQANEFQTRGDYRHHI